jgi:L-alanine-DL-glutamate epimerase-like enolase superfamily enzyme
MRIIAKQLHVIPIKHVGGQRVSHRGNWVLLALETDTGLIGWGEGSDSHDEDNCIALIDEFAGSFLNQEIEPSTVAANLTQSAPPPIECLAPPAVLSYKRSSS